MTDETETDRELRAWLTSWERIGGLPADKYAFGSVPAFVSLRGQRYAVRPLTPEQQTYAQRALMVPGLREEECWNNSRHIVLNADPELRFSYVEGYCLDEKNQIPIDHGWLLLDGQAVVETRTDYQGQAAYFGVLFERAYVASRASRIGRSSTTGKTVIRSCGGDRYSI